MKQTLIPNSYYETELFPFKSPFSSEKITKEKDVSKYASDINLATTTFYPSKDGKMAADVKLRAELALNMLRSAQFHYHSVIVVDGGSDAGWRKEAVNHGAKLIDEVRNENHTMGAGRRQALSAAGNMGKPIICWLEPEKYPFVTLPLIRSAAPVYDSRADIVVPRRMDELESYPVQQRFEELTGNLTVMELLRGYLIKQGLTIEESERRVPYLDQWIGPRVMNQTGLEYFLNYNGKIGDAVHDRWESIFVPLWQAMIEGKAKVRGVAVPYVHPREQTELESSTPEYSLKRVQQLNVIVDAANKFVGQFKTAQ